MLNLRPVFLTLGILVTCLGGIMCLPLALEYFAWRAGRPSDWQAFSISAVLCIFLGVSITAGNWGRVKAITVREGFMITALSWIVLVFFASFPFCFSILKPGFTNAFFEAMSGLTTTGATVMTELDTAPAGILLWRSILQWIGGIGIVIMAIALMPMLSIGGMQLFRLQSSDTSDKMLPGASQIAGFITLFYVLMTVTCCMMYWGFGMSGFDALNHAMTTIATGGFSTKDTSFGYFLGASGMHGPLDIISVVFMILGALPFALYFLMLRGQAGAIWADSQSRFFLVAILAFVAIIMMRLLTIYDFSFLQAFRLAAFNVVSIMTGTGYASTDYGLWGSFSFGFFFCIMFVGGCAGSTSCGLKVFRLQVALAALRVYAQRLAHPHGVFIARYNGRPLTNDVFVSVLSFFFVYFAVFATTAVCLSLFQLDLVTSLSAAASAVANVGPGLGDIIGPAGNYKSLPDGAKWILCCAMLLGRLEFFTLLVFLSPSFWRQ